MDRDRRTTRKKQLIRPASAIRRRAKGTGYIEDIIVDIMTDLDAEVDEAIERTENMAEIPLPTDFDIPTMNNKDSQRRIYGIILEACLEAEYTPKLIFSNGNRAENQKVKLQVRWNTKSDEEEDKYIHQLIQKYSTISNESDTESKSMKYKGKTKKNNKKSDFKDTGPKYTKNPSLKSGSHQTGKPSRMATNSDIDTELKRGIKSEVSHRKYKKDDDSSDDLMY